MDEACCMKRFKLSRIAVCKNQGIYHFHGDQTQNKTQRKRSIKKVHHLAGAFLCGVSLPTHRRRGGFTGDSKIAHRTESLSVSVYTASHPVAFGLGSNPPGR